MCWLLLRADADQKALAKQLECSGQNPVLAWFGARLYGSTLNLICWGCTFDPCLKYLLHHATIGVKHSIIFIICRLYPLSSTSLLFETTTIKIHYSKTSNMNDGELCPLSSTGNFGGRLLVVKHQSIASHLPGWRLLHDFAWSPMRRSPWVAMARAVGQGNRWNRRKRPLTPWEWNSEFDSWAKLRDIHSSQCGLNQHQNRTIIKTHSYV